LASARSSSGGIGEHVVHRLGHVDDDVAGVGPEAGDGTDDDLLHADRPQLDGQRRCLHPAHVQQVADDVAEAIGLLLDRRLELVTRRAGPLDVALTQARDRRLDRCQWRAQVVGDRLQQRRPHRVGGGEVGRPHRLHLQPLALVGHRDLGGERVEQPLVLTRQLTPASASVTPRPTSRLTSASSGRTGAPGPDDTSTSHPPLARASSAAARNPNVVRS
jgi:hypothetical protein